MRGEYPRESCRLTSAWELPPRARRILPRLGRAFGIPGTTSACAENTCCNAWSAFNPRNYLRVRGEYAYWGSLRSSLRELPPRARRIPLEHTAGHILAGTTSACAENTGPCCGAGPAAGNYLRVRGEYSPRVGKSTTQSGTTSACAENTPTGLPSSFKKRNYLRVRGEYPFTFSANSLNRELPPRARRIQSVNSPQRRLPGTTSACAENTGGACERFCGQWNYLRVRGEYRCTLPHSCSIKELPPRARRIQLATLQPLQHCGTTSACAENTIHGSGIKGLRRNYLRVRGEYATGGLARH